MPERNAVFLQQFREDLTYWVVTERKVALRILQLVEAILRDPFTGIGKPERLKYSSSKNFKLWSRRIDDEHRLVYLVKEEYIEFIQARYHYRR